MKSSSSSTPSVPEAIVVNPPEQNPEEHAAEAVMASQRENLQEAYRRRAEKLSSEELLEAYIQQGLEMRETHDELTWLAVELCWATDGSLGAALRQVRELVRRLRERAENAETVAAQAQELLSSIKIPHNPFGSLRDSHSSEADEPKVQVPTCKACGRSLCQAVEPGRNHLYHPAGFCSASKE